MDFELIAQATRVTARISLVLFAIAFASEAFRIAHRRQHFLWLGFCAAHLLHLGFVVAYFIWLGEPPELNTALALLVLGLFAFGWMVLRLASSKSSRRGKMMPDIAVWYVWLLFWMAHATRLMDPERGSWVNAVLLIIALSAGLVRIIAARKQIVH